MSFPRICHLYNAGAATKLRGYLVHAVLAVPTFIKLNSGSQHRLSYNHNGEEQSHRKIS